MYILYEEKEIALPANIVLPLFSSKMLFSPNYKNYITD